MRMLLRRGHVGALALLLVLALAPAAAAQDEDPQVDPSSPAGTEYELPIDRAREQASGGSAGGGGPGAPTSADGETPLFGEGVAPKGTAGATAQPGSRTTTGDDRAGTSDAGIVRAQAGPPDGGGAGALAIGGGAAGVLVIGGAAGLLWRRRSGQQG